MKNDRTFVQFLHKEGFTSKAVQFLNMPVNVIVREDEERKIREEIYGAIETRTTFLGSEVDSSHVTMATVVINIIVKTNTFRKKISTTP